MPIKIVDNFLEPFEFLEIKNTLESDTLQWYYNNDIIPSVSSDKDFYNHQLVHTFYQNPFPNSSFHILEPLYKKLNIDLLIRAKANLSLFCGTHGPEYFHPDDNRNLKVKSAIYYISTNNGYTLFENREKVDSVENRILIFDSKLKHTGSYSTNTKRRISVNLVYIEKE